MPFLNEKVSQDFLEKIFFFFISLLLIIEIFISLFNFITPIINIINGIIQQGWNSLVFNDLFIFINILYMIILLILALLINRTKNGMNNVILIFIIILIISIIRIPDDLLKFFYFISAFMGINTVVSVIPSYQMTYYLIYWGCEGILVVVLLIFLIAHTLKLLLSKDSPFALFKFLDIYLTLYFVLKMIDFIFILGFESYFGSFNINYMIQQISLLICLLTGWLFVHIFKKNKEPKLIIIAKIPFIFLGIYNILFTFNEINVETLFYIVLKISLGISLILFGILFNKMWIKMIQNNLNMDVSNKI